MIYELYELITLYIYRKTHICQKKHKELLVALTRAKDYGTITFDLPIKEYDYSEWKPSNN